MSDNLQHAISRSPFRRQAILFFWFIVSIGIVLQTSLDILPARWVGIESVVLVVLGVMSLSMLLPRGFWAPAPLFLLVVAVFHVGLAPFLILNLDPLFPRVDDYIWFVGPTGTRAFSLVNIFLSFFVTSVCCISALRLNAMPGDMGTKAKFVLGASETERSRLAMSTFGAATLSLGILYWFFIALSSGGFSIFFGSYIAFLNATAGSSLPMVYMLISLGLGLAMLGFERRIVRASLMLFAVFAFIAFFLGLRGEVLFPAAVAASVLAFRCRMPRGGFVVVVVALALVLIDAAKRIRQLGFAAGLPIDSAFSPLSALAELGSSLRVVAHVVIWHDFQGEPLYGGATYTVSLARLWENLFSPGGSPSALGDFRLMNSEVMARSGAIGGSVVAEAFHNFGVLGVAGGAVMLGVLFGIFSVRRFSVLSASIYVCVAVPLFNHVRNSFVPVLPFVIVSLLVVLGVYYLSRESTKPDMSYLVRE